MNKLIYALPLLLASTGCDVDGSSSETEQLRSTITHTTDNNGICLEIVTNSLPPGAVLGPGYSLGSCPESMTLAKTNEQVTRFLNCPVENDDESFPASFVYYSKFYFIDSENGTQSDVFLASEASIDETNEGCIRFE